MSTITRTFTTYVVEYLAMDTVKNEAVKSCYVLPKNVYGQDRERRIIKIIQKAVGTDTFKIVSIKSITLQKELREMSLEDFYKYSRPAPEIFEKRQQLRTKQKGKNKHD